MKKYTRYMVMALATVQLTGCETFGWGSPDVEKPSRQERVDAAIEKAAITASRHGSKNATLVALEKRYKRQSENPEVAIQYAKALRKANYMNKASAVLRPFADQEDAHAGAKTEMSMIELARGKYSEAEKYAQDAILQDATDYQAYQNLGIALDAKEMHPEAERAFRKGLEHWQGNPTPIMNNLALNLATQGFIDEAIEVLEQAKALSPDRIEIERNLRIVRTLNER